MNKKVVFGDLDKWLIFKNRMMGNRWFVTPPFDVDKEIEKDFATYEQAVSHFIAMTDGVNR